MRLEGKIYKEGEFWISEIPYLDLMTQGKTRADAEFMMKDAIEILIDKPSFSVNATSKNSLLWIETDQLELLYPLILKRFREKTGMSVREISEKMGYKSHNSYARYELGQTKISAEKLSLFISSMSSKSNLVLKILGS